MRDLADSIAGILHDYHAYNDFDFTADHVIKWVEQFDAGDQQFILEEFLHLLQQGIYVSEDKGRELLMKSINELARFYKLTPINFIKNLKVLSLQKAGKSQATLISIFYEEIEKNFGLKESIAEVFRTNMRCILTMSLLRVKLFSPILEAFGIKKPKLIKVVG